MACASSPSSGKPAAMLAAGALRARQRRRWLTVHRWVGLVLGLLMALIGLSGAVLVLRAPLLQWEVGRDAVTAAPGSGPHASAEQWQAAARQAYPAFARIMGAAPPRTGFLLSDNAVVFGALRDRAGMGVAMIDPRTASPRGFFVFDDLWLAKAVAVHRSLMLPPSLGGPVIALCGMALTVSLASGAWLWWPRNGAWRNVLFMRRGANLARRLFDWHAVIAAWLALPLAVLAITGTWLAQPRWFAWVAEPGGVKPTMNALHASLMLGWPGQALVFAAGLVLPMLLGTGLAMWWRKWRARRAVFSQECR